MSAMTPATTPTARLYDRDARNSYHGVHFLDCHQMTDLMTHSSTMDYLDIGTGLYRWIAELLNLLRLRFK
jgi:hypothetical protein